MTSTTSCRPAVPGGPFATAVAVDDADGSDGARGSGPCAPPARSTAGARTGSGRPAQKCCTANPTATTSTRTRAASAFGSVPHRNCTHSGSRSRTAHHIRSPRRERGGSCPGGGGPASAATPASPKIAAARARTLSRSHSRRSAPPEGTGAPAGTVKAEADEEATEGSDAAEEPEDAEGAVGAEEAKGSNRAEAPPGGGGGREADSTGPDNDSAPANTADGSTPPGGAEAEAGTDSEADPTPAPKAPAEPGNPHDADRDKFIPTDAKHPAQISPSSLKSGGCSPSCG